MEQKAGQDSAGKSARESKNQDEQSEKGDK
jgi:hypothetical protein